jgi:DNA-binding NarL/FixJ family response regulator
LKRVRLILADDHPAILETVTRLLEHQFEIVGTAVDGQTLIEDACRLKPDIIIMDISMPILSGLDAARKLMQTGSTTKIVFLTVHHDPDIVRACLDCGAFGYVIKPRLATDLVLAIRDALAGGIFVSPPLGTQG